jgi:hypothetical protein
MVERLEQVFPALRGREYRITSPRDKEYNCVARAASDTSQAWWPVEATRIQRVYWPPGVPREETLEAFRQAFAALGYVVYDDDRLEEGFEKVAVSMQSRVG